MSDERERHTFQVDVETENPLALVQSRLNDLDLNDGLTRVQVRLESREPIQVKTQESDDSDGGVVDSPPEDDVASSGMGPATAAGEQEGQREDARKTVTCEDCGKELDATGKSPGQVLAGHRIHCPNSGDGDGDGDASDDVVRFREDGDAFHVIKTLYSREGQGFLELDEVRQFTPNDAGVPDERFSAILWDLDDRGLVEKQPPKNGGRQHRYRITDRGVASVEASM